MDSKFKKIEFNSDFFNLLELSKGIYAAQVKENSFAGANGGFFDLGGIVIMWDAFLNIDAAQDLLKAINMFTGKDPDFVVISHRHTDHILGNYVIPKQIPIISGPKVVEQIKSISMQQIETFSADPTQKIKELQEKLSKETDPIQKRDQQLDIRFYEYLIKNNPEFRLPNVLFTGEMEFRGTNSTLILWNVGKRHTKEDILALFPKEKICFMGDLINNSFNSIPIETAKQFFTAEPKEHIELLEDLINSDYKIFHAGHGEIGDPKSLQKNIDFIKTKLME